MSEMSWFFIALAVGMFSAAAANVGTAWIDAWSEAQTVQVDSTEYVPVTVPEATAIQLTCIAVPRSD